MAEEILPKMTLEDRCNSIEECYEFMLAYAALGLPGDEGNPSGAELREFLRRGIEALSGMQETCKAAIAEAGLEPSGTYSAFLSVLERDAEDSITAMELVSAQPALSSQLIDNLNASIHLRALLTDLFLIDEILKPQRLSATPAATSE
jgi:hypothetical protein